MRGAVCVCVQRSALEDGIRIGIPREQAVITLLLVGAGGQKLNCSDNKKEGVNK